MIRRPGISAGGRLLGAVVLAAGLSACTKGAPAVYVPNVTHVNGVPVEDYKPKKSDRRKDMVLTVADPAAVASSTASPEAADVAPEPATPAVETTAAAESVADAVSASPSSTAQTTSVAASTAASASSAASTVATTSASTASDVATSATSAASTSGSFSLSGLMTPLAGLATPAVIAAAEMGPEGGVLAAATFVDGERVEVAVVDAETVKRVGLRASDVAAAGDLAVRVTGPGAGR